MNIKKIATLIFCLTSFFVTQVKSSPTIGVPEIVLTNVPFEVSVTDFEQQQVCEYQLQINDFIFEPTVCNGNELIFEYLLAEEKSDNQLELLLDQKKIASEEINVLSGWLSILPPLVSILVALLFRSVIPALFLGVWIGSFAILGLKIGVLWQSFLDVVSKYVKQALADPDHAAVIIFSLMIGGLVGIISKNGGMQGIVNSLTRFTSSPKRGQLITSSLGLAIFWVNW